jgi:CRISPR-associated protein Cas6/Cse3/CasE subtype I-E
MNISKLTLTHYEYALFKGNNYLIHQELCNIFAESGVTFSVNNNNKNVSIIAISNNEVKNSPKYGKIITKEYNIDNLSIGEYKIMVDLNAVKQIRISGKSNCKKVPVVGDDVSNWLNNRSSSWGIEITNMEIGVTHHNLFYKKNHKIYCDWHSVTFICKVVDIDLFKQMVINGIGSQKSFGFGMIKLFKVK